MPEGFAVNPEVLQRGRYGAATPGDPSKPESPLRNAQLMPADPNKGYATPYYAAYTNDGDFAGAVMVAPGQKIRLVDKMTGDVVFEGAGPEAAQTATAVANSISQNQGRTAAWAIQKPTDEGGWVSMAEERWDPKKQSLLGKVADFALPIIGAILAPGIGLAWAAVGSAAGSALSSAAQGRSFEDTVKRAALSAGLTFVGGTAVGKLGKVLANSESPIGQAMYNGYSAVMKPLNAVTRAVDGAGSAVTDTLGNAVSGAGNTVREVIVQGVKGGVDAVTGGALSAVGGSAVTGAGGQNVMQGGTGVDTVGNTIEGVDVTANTDPLTGAGVGALTSVVTTPSTTEPSVPGVVVEGGGNDSLTGGGAGAGAGTLVGEVVVEGGGNDSLTGGGAGAGAADTLSGTDDGETSSDPGDDKLDPDKKPPGMSWADWLKLLSLVSGGVATATQGSGPASLPAGVLDAGTPGSLPDIFRAKLPSPSGPFADMSARNVSMTPEEWATYGQRGQVAFLNSTPQRPSGILAPPKTGFKADVGPVVGRTLAGEVEPTPAPSANPEDFARGGFAVRGMGSGRDDKIPARLSDGEYVIDAETVALLGDGSTKAGADRLDKFRVNIRKHKGRKLAKGAFSANAKPPEAYLRGGRT